MLIKLPVEKQEYTVVFIVDVGDLTSRVFVNASSQAVREQLGDLVNAWSQSRNNVNVRRDTKEKFSRTGEFSKSCADVALSWATMGRVVNERVSCKPTGQWFSLIHHRTVSYRR